jgi:heme exporter protein C
VIPRLLLFFGVALALAGGFLWAPPVAGLEETTRVLYLHIPCAWIAVLALGWSTVHSILYLRTRRIGHDDHAAAGAGLGVLFCVGATVSGSLWAQARWGAWWNWDPRETTIVLLLLVYGAYLALRGAIEGEERRARLASVYAVLAFATVPFLVFVVPRLYDTLHPSPIVPQAGEAGTMHPRVWICFLVMLAGFTGLFFWMESLEVRLRRRERCASTERAERA